MTEITLSKRPEFCSIPMELFFNPNIPDGALRLFCIFYLYKSSPTGCYASNAYLSKLTGIDERSVTRNIRVLEQWRYIKIINKKSIRNRRIFIDPDYKTIYRQAVDTVYQQRRDLSKFDKKKQKELFINSLKNYIEKEV